MIIVLPKAWSAPSIFHRMFRGLDKSGELATRDRANADRETTGDHDLMLRVFVIIPFSLG